MFCRRKRDDSLEREEKRISDQIDNKIKQWHKDEGSIIKLLLLGTGEAGKTTILKQMRIIHINGFTDEEKREKLNDIHNNIHESIYDLVRHMKVINPPIEFSDENNEKSANFILNLGENKPEIITDEYYDHIQQLWNDLGVKQCYKRSNEFQLIDCAKYFLDKLNDIRQSNYLPSEQDILYSRKKTTVITKVEFSVKIPKKYGGGSQKFWMFDVGGQRSYRRKWIHVFAGVNAVVFLIATNDFDQKLREDSETNRLQESIDLFESVWSNKFLMQSGFIIFLNKQDLLKEKINNGKKINKYFPDFDDFHMSEKDGNPFDEFDKTRCFIRFKLMEITKKRRTITHMIAGKSILEEDIVNRDCFYHFTTATDTDNIKKVFNDVHTIILTSNLTSVGIF